MRLRPLRILCSCNVLVRAQLEGIRLLVSPARDRDDLVCSHRLGEHDTKVTKSTNADNTNSLAWTTAVVLQRAVHGDATAQHGGSFCRGDRVGNLDNEVRRRSVVQSISAIGLAAIQVYAVVGSYSVLTAVLFQTHGTLGTVTQASEAGIALSTNAHAVANLDAALGLGTDTDSNTDNFMTDTARILCWTLYNC